MHEPAFWWRSPGIYSALLAPMALLYDAIASRRMAIPGARAKVPVICVGNFTLGGAGKTPTAILLGRLLVEEGERPFFLSRGYGGSIAGPKLVDLGSDNSRTVGDEPMLLARTAPTVIAKDRVAGAEFASRLGATVIVMDDGLQNGSLAKDFTVAVVDARRGIGNACVFPAGPLRAAFDAQVARIDMLLVVGTGKSASEVAASAHRRDLPVLRGHLAPDASAVAALKTGKVLAFAGIGDPGKFFDTAKTADITVGECRAFPDHHRYTAEDARSLIARADQSRLTLLTTEKDGARIAGEPSLKTLADRVRTLPVAMAVDELNELRQLLTLKIKR